jgi:hypothetical protein
MARLAVAIQRREVRFPEGVIRDELEVFEYAYTRTRVRYTAPAGLHDDCVCALALAVHHAAQKPKHRFNVDFPLPSDGLDWFEEEI